MKKLITTTKASFLIVGVVVGLVSMYFYLQPKLSYEQAQTVYWKYTASLKQTVVDQKQGEIQIYKNQLASTDAQLASASAQIKTLSNRPPEVIYKTQYVQQSTQDNTYDPTNCYPDQLGGQYCRSLSGKQTHCVSNLIGGMICN